MSAFDRAQAVYDTMEPPDWLDLVEPSEEDEIEHMTFQETLIEWKKRNLKNGAA